MRFDGTVLMPGIGKGTALVLDQPLSFGTWGHISPETGDIIDSHHPQRGTSLAGRVLLMPSGLESGSSSAVIVEMVRAGTSPAAVLLAGARDPNLVLGAIVARELYGQAVPIIGLGDKFGRVMDGAFVTVDQDGAVTCAPRYEDHAR